METLYRLLIPLAQAQAATTKAADTSTNSAAANAATFIIEKIPLWIAAAVVLVISIVIASMAKGFAENKLAGKVDDEQQEVVIITGRITFAVVAIVGVSAALAIAGINLTTMLAAVGFGISFGLQDVIGNFVAGLGILISRPFKMGDWIKVNDNVGKVVEIKTRATYLKTYDGMRLIVPNSELYKSSVLSYTSNPTQRIVVYGYCRYGVDINEVIKIFLDVGNKEPKILKQPQPSVIVNELYDSYIELKLRGWIETDIAWRRLRSKLTMQIQKRLEEAQMDAPYAVTSISFEDDATQVLSKNKVMEAESEEADSAKGQGPLDQTPIQNPTPPVTLTQFEINAQPSPTMNAPVVPISNPTPTVIPDQNAVTTATGTSTPEQNIPPVIPINPPQGQ